MMRAATWWSVALAAGLMSGLVRAGDSGYLVKLSGHDRKSEWLTMSEADFKALDKNLKQELKFFPKAVEAAGKEWRADELNKKIAFPGVRLVPRTIVSAQQFPSLEKAEAQLGKIQDQEARKLQKQAEKEKGRPPPKPSKEQMEKEENTGRAVDLVKAKLNALMGRPAEEANLAAGGEKAAEGREPEKKEEKAAGKAGKAKAAAD